LPWKQKRRGKGERRKKLHLSRSQKGRKGEGLWGFDGWRLLRSGRIRPQEKTVACDVGGLGMSRFTPQVDEKKRTWIYIL